jgi:hypothetical protein
MLKSTLAFFLCSLFCKIAYAQPALVWQKTYGGSNHEYIWETIPTSDGGYAFVGFSESGDGDVSGNKGGVDLWVGKINAAGTIQWSNLYGGTQDEQGYDILQTADNGFMVAGWTESSDGNVTGHHGTSTNEDLWVLKLSSSGALVWNKCFGGTGNDDATAIVQTQHGNYYISGSTYSYDGDVTGNHGSSEPDFWVIEINAGGTLLKQKCVGGSNYEEGINMALTLDNGCILCGRTSSNDYDAIGYHAGSDMLIAKLDSNFVVQWSKCYGGSATEECNSIVQLSDGSYAALGYTSTHNNGDVSGHHGSQGSDDFWLLKLTSAGAISWAKCYGGDSDDQANGLIISADGGYVMCGLTFSGNGDVSGYHPGSFLDPDIWVAKVNSSGTFQWQRCCGGSGQDESFNVFEEGGGTCVLTGFTYSSDYDVTLNRGSADGWILKVTGNAFVRTYPENERISIYPNPAKDMINILTDSPSDILISDPAGRKVYAVNDFRGGSITLPGLKAGIYFIEILNTDIHTVKRLEIKGAR